MKPGPFLQLAESRMETDVSFKNIGLRGITVADTKISFIDGVRGILIYRGFRIEDLAEISSFEETAYLLLNGGLPDKEGLAAFRDALTAAGRLPDEIPESFKLWPRRSDPMDIIQASVPILAMIDPELAAESREANLRKAIRVIARLPEIITTWHRMRNGLQPLPHDPKLGHAGNFLWKLTGKKPEEEMARAFEVSLILQADHAFSASTFACREVVSTRAHLYAGVTAGVGALSGILHGGSNALVMRVMFDMIDQGMTTKDIGAWVKGKLDRREKIMGMGHAVYKTTDPRAEILKGLCENIAIKTEREEWFNFLRAIETECIREFEKRGKRKIKANVDFYSGLLCAMLGIPLDIMTPVFAMAIAVGWCSHIIEEKFGDAQGKPVLYRPESKYVGHYCGQFGCTYLPIEQR